MTISLRTANDNEIALLVYCLESYMDDEHGHTQEFIDDAEAIFKDASEQYKARKLKWNMFMERE